MRLSGQGHLGRGGSSLLPLFSCPIALESHPEIPATDSPSFLTLAINPTVTYVDRELLPAQVLGGAGEG